MKVYIASSWRNRHYDILIEYLNRTFPSLDLYNFKTANSAFSWRELEPLIEVNKPYENWTVGQYLSALKTLQAEVAFENDFNALKASDIVIICNPCGESAHIEAAYHHGTGKSVIDFYPNNKSNSMSSDGKQYSLELMKAMFEYRAIGYYSLNNVLAELISNEPHQSESHPTSSPERDVQCDD